MSKSTPIQPLNVGDRVRVYGWVNMHHSPYKPRGGGPATVTYIEDECFCHVKFDDDETHYSAHPKQVRRLKKKPRPQKERVERWIAGTCDIKNGDPHWQEAWANPIKIGTEHIHLVELREGEAIVSREALERESALASTLSQIASGGGPVDATTYRTWERTDMMNYARKALNRWKALGLPGKEPTPGASGREGEQMRDTFFRIHGEDPGAWALKHGIELFDAKCPDCGTTLQLSIPIKRKGEPGLMAEECKCGSKDTPYCFTIDWSKHDSL